MLFLGWRTEVAHLIRWALLMSVGAVAAPLLVETQHTDCRAVHRLAWDLNAASHEETATLSALLRAKPGSMTFLLAQMLT